MIQSHLLAAEGKTVNAVFLDFIRFLILSFISSFWTSYPNMMSWFTMHWVKTWLEDRAYGAEVKGVTSGW